MMKLRKTTQRFATSIALACAMTVGVTTLTSFDTAYAQAEGRQFGSKAGEAVLGAQNMMTANDFSGAINKLNQVLGFSGLNPFETSTVYQMLGQCYYEQDQYNQAVTAFESAISAGGLLPKEQDSLRVNIAQLLIANEQYARGGQMLENWINSGGQPKPAHVEMLTHAWVQSENYSKALPWAERWFGQASPKEKKHFDLLNFLYNNLNMPGKQADIIKEMIRKWPEDNTYWTQWVSLLANGGREEEAFEVNKMLYLGGAKTSSDDLLKIVEYYQYYDMPYQAAEILEKEMNAGRIPQTPDRLVRLSDLYRQAREYKRAIPILERAAKQAGTAKAYADWGEALHREGECTKAEEILKQAITKGYDKDKAWSLIASCRYEDAQKEARADCKTSTAEERAGSVKNQKRDKAIAAYQKVSAGSRLGRDAKKWIKFIQDERQAVEDRCIFEANLVKERCYFEIERAYASQVFTGEFELDEKCSGFKDEYDDKYRKSVSAGG